jgi:calcineurin-like phosphoesterase family protein
METNVIYFTSDLHINHKNVIKYCNRPFPDTKEMELKLIENYNAIINDEDTVYFLGDIFFCGVNDAKRIMTKLKGNKILVIGNHDKSATKMREIGFTKVHNSLQIIIDNKTVNMSHYPYKPDLTWMPKDMKAELIKINSMPQTDRNGKDKRNYIDELISVFLNDGKITQKMADEFNIYDLRFIDKRLEDDGNWLLCGHVHEKWKIKNKMINIGVDVWNFSPVSIEDISKIIFDCEPV